jgi:shikimate kinase
MKISSTDKLQPLHFEKPIVLLGMMGAGKTTFGKKLATRLELKFLDVDIEIEKDMGHSISWIFQNAGEQEFRKLELRKIEEILSRREPLVLALGGGAFASEKVRDIVKKYAISVWLKASPEVILHRVSTSNNKRPLLEEAEDKLAKIKEILLDRIKFYEKANIGVSTETGTHREIVENIIIALTQFK